MSRRDDEAIFKALGDLLACVSATVELTAAGLPGFVSVLDGDPEWDCSGYQNAAGTIIPGQLWVRKLRAFPTGNFPLPDTTYSVALPGTLCLDVEVGVLRCAPTVHDDGSPPSPTERTASARQVEDDGLAVIRGINCCVGVWHTTPALFRQGMLVEQLGLGPAGGCVGTATRAFVGLSNCAC